MKTIAIIIILLLVSTLAQADKIIIPFSAYPKDVQVYFKDNGIMLDLSGNDRTPESWGFLVNEGSQCVIYTYRSITHEELELMKKYFIGGE